MGIKFFFDLCFGNVVEEMDFLRELKVFYGR